MNKFFPMLLLLVVLMSACAAGGGGAAKEASALLSATDFQEKMARTDGEILIDLRSHGELHHTGPIVGARTLDYNSGVFSKLAKNFKKEDIYMLYCATGNRSSKAAEELKAMGITKVYDLQGGIKSWREAGLPVQAHHH